MHGLQLFVLVMEANVIYFSTNKPSETKTTVKVSTFLFTINTVCTAKLKSTLLSSNSKLKYYDTSHMNICISSSSVCLTDVVVNIFFYHLEHLHNRSHIFIDIYIFIYTQYFYKA